MKQKNEQPIAVLIAMLTTQLVEQANIGNFIDHFFEYLENYYAIEGVAFYQPAADWQPEYFFYRDAAFSTYSDHETDWSQHQWWHEKSPLQMPGSQLYSTEPMFFAMKGATLQHLSVAVAKEASAVFHFFSSRKDAFADTAPFITLATLSCQYLSNFLTRQRAKQQNADLELREVLNHAPIALFSIDEQGIMRTCEGGGLWRIGLKGGDHIGASVFDVFKDHPAVLADVQKALKGDRLSSMIRIGRHVYENRCLPVFDAQGRIKRVIIVSIDMTRRDKVENALKKQKVLLNEILDALPVNIFLKNQQGRFVFINKQTAINIGIGRDDVIGKTDFDIFPSGVAQAFYQDDEEVRRRRKLIMKESQQTWQGQAREIFEGKTLVSLSDRGEGLLLGYQIDITGLKRAENQIQLLRQWIDQSSDGIYVTDMDGKFVFVNKAAADYLSHPVEQLLTMNIQQTGMLWHNDWQQYVSELRTHQNVLFEVSAQTPRNRELPVEVNARYIEVSNQGYIVAFLRDISLRRQTEKELQEQKEFIDQVINTDPNLIYVRDYEGKFLLVNQAVADHFDTTAGEVLQQSHNIIPYSLGQLESYVMDEEVIEMRKAVRIEEIIPKPNGEIHHFYTTKIPLMRPDGKVHVLAISTDITEQKQIQRELIEAREQAERAKAAEDLFLANMSHEVRTPINGIIGFINLLLSSPLTAQQKNYLKSIKTSADNLKVIINDILDFTKIEFGKLSFEKTGFYIGEQVRTVVASFEMQTREKSIVLDCHVDKSLSGTVLLGDPVRLNQIMINLLSNAVKFTLKGKISVRVEKAPVVAENPQVQFISFSVSDTGIGIPEDKLTSVFDHFTQADESITRKFGGTGLGLSICKQLVELQDGKIEVQSRVDYGTTFTFVIPYEIGSVQDLPDLEQKKIGLSTIRRLLKGKRILVVEDNSINQALALNILHRWTVVTDVAENGLIAIEKLQRYDFDLVLMDIQMPLMDGFEATRYIRSTFPDPLRHIPIIALTANATLGYEQQCLKAGMDDYISKPFVQETLLNKILKALNISKYVAKENVKSMVSPAENAAVDPNPVPPVAIQNQSAQLIDLSYLREFSGNDKNFIMEMIAIFIEACKQELPLVMQAAEDQRWADVKLLVHKLKPSITFMGIHQLKQDVQTCEDLAEKRKDPERITMLVNLIHDTCQRAVEELEVMINSGQVVNN